MSYWDSSALVKLFVAESDSSKFRALAASKNQLVSGTVGQLEVRAYLRRREAEGLLAQGGSRALNSDLQDDIARGRLKIRLFDDAVEDEFSKVLEKCFAPDTRTLLCEERASAAERRECG